jgi:phosphoglycolate phosphatase-like HAD superfamily hydrolase
MKTRVAIVVTDLDDTLWDWVSIWYHPFKAMLDKICEISGVPREELLRDFQEVHTRHGTSEYAFALEELPSLIRKHPGEDIVAVYAEAIEAYRNARRQVMKLYPDVLETLESIKDRGTLIVGYTESLAFYTRYRLLKLGLDRTLDFLYSPADHDLPKGLTTEAIRKYSPESYRLRRTVHRHTPAGKEKPSPEVLLQILADVGARPDEAIYIGDKLVKDVAMAQAAGVTDVHAAYGDAHNREEYELLRSVTHWTPEAVEREIKTTIAQIQPSYTLRNSIAELYDYFEFVPFVDCSEARTAHVVDIWKKAVDVQQHFNDIELRIRNYVITLVVAVLGAAGIAVKEHLLALASAVLLFGVAGVLLFCMMDVLWYHRLLIGAVRQAGFIERRLVRHLPEMGLTDAIGKASPFKLWRWRVHSSQKLWAFYILMIVFLVLGAVLLPGLCSHPEPDGADTGTASIASPERSANSRETRAGRTGETTLRPDPNIPAKSVNVPQDGDSDPGDSGASPSFKL